MKGKMLQSTMQYKYFFKEPKQVKTTELTLKNRIFSSTSKNFINFIVPHYLPIIKINFQKTYLYMHLLKQKMN